MQREMLDEELIRMREENKKLVTMLTNLCENYTSLKTQIIELQQKYSTHEEDNSKLCFSRKRKAEEDCSENYVEEASPKRPREITTDVSTVCVKTNPSDQNSVSSSKGFSIVNIQSNLSIIIKNIQSNDIVIEIVFSKHTKSIN